MAGIPALIMGLMAFPKASASGKIRAGIGIGLGLANLGLTLFWIILSAAEGY